MHARKILTANRALRCAKALTSMNVPKLSIPVMSYSVKPEPVRIPDVTAMLTKNATGSKLPKAFSPTTELMSLLDGEEDEEGRRCHGLREPPDKRV